ASVVAIACSTESLTSLTSRAATGAAPHFAQSVCSPSSATPQLTHSAMFSAVQGGVEKRNRRRMGIARGQLRTFDLRIFAPFSRHNELLIHRRKPQAHYSKRGASSFNGPKNAAYQRVGG